MLQLPAGRRKRRDILAAQWSHGIQDSTPWFRAEEAGGHAGSHVVDGHPKSVPCLGGGFAAVRARCRESGFSRGRGRREARGSGDERGQPQELSERHHRMALGDSVSDSESASTPGRDEVSVYSRV